MYSLKPDVRCVFKITESKKETAYSSDSIINNLHISDRTRGKSLHVEYIARTELFKSIFLSTDSSLATVLNGKAPTSFSPRL